MVELHGGTGYLLSQFVSPRTNLRDDEYGGSPENRMNFPLEVLTAVKETVSIPVGYRFLADEWLPGGLDLDSSIPFAKKLDSAGVAYLSVTGGTWESFMLPDVFAKTLLPGFMTDLSAAIKEKVNVPVIAAGSISNGNLAESILKEEKADLIGLARPLLADPMWPQKALNGKDNEILCCDPECPGLCMQLIMAMKPVYCSKWQPEKTRQWKNLFK